MRNKSLGVLGLCMIGAAPLLAQAPPPSDSSPVILPLSPAGNQPPPALPQGRNGSPSADPTGLLPPDYVPSPPMRLLPSDPERYHVWVRADLLLWWVKDAPLPVPVAQVVDAGNNQQTVIGNSNTSFGVLSGGRLALGAWFDPFNNYGFETGFFSLARRFVHQGVSADDNGNPSISLPFFSMTPGQTGEFIQPLSSPGTFTGDILVSSSLQLWGAEVNGAICLWRTAGFEFTSLFGFRYLDLQERLNFFGDSFDVTSGNGFFFNDRFSTHNQFSGGQLGARINWNLNRLAFDATGKLAMGTTHQVVDIHGSSPLSDNGGFFAQPSNIGRTTANRFGIIPSLELKLRYNIYSSWQLFFGYDFMYWNEVVRPGNQVDRNLNLTQSSVFGTGTLNGPATPVPLFNRTDFWAQGITFGLELRY